MNRWEQDWADEEWDEAGPDYGDDDDESEVVSCPACGGDVYEDAERCPRCGDYIVHSSTGYVWKDRPLWWMILGVLGIVAVIFALLPLI